MIREVAEAYDRWAPQYDLTAAGSEVAEAEDDWLRRDVIRFLPPHGQIIHDVGCGTGGLLDLLDIPPSKYIGVDISPGMIAEARRKHPDHRFVVGDMHATGSVQPAGLTFMGYGVIGLSPTPYALMDRLARDTLPGGWLYMIATTPRHREQECACHEYERGLMRTYHTPREAAGLVGSGWCPPEVRFMPSPAEHAGSYLVVTARRREYRDPNDEREWVPCR